MRISYVNTFEHAVRFNLHQQSRNRFQQISFVIAVGLTAYIYWYQWQGFFDNQLMNWLAFFVLEFACLLFLVLSTLGMILFSISPIKNVSNFTNHEITLTDETLTEVTPFNKTERSWSGIYKVVQDRSLIYIFASSNSAYLIPKNAFESSNKVKEFYDYAYKCWQSKKIV